MKASVQQESKKKKPDQCDRAWMGPEDVALSRAREFIQADAPPPGLGKGGLAKSVTVAG
jgi:hypothetical protein